MLLIYYFDVSGNSWDLTQNPSNTYSVCKQDYWCGEHKQVLGLILSAKTNVENTETKICTSIITEWK
jgi:hypothetical protein